jgi:hypothetical protein
VLDDGEPVDLARIVENQRLDSRGGRRRQSAAQMRQQRDSLVRERTDAQMATEGAACGARDRRAFGLQCFEARLDRAEDGPVERVARRGIAAAAEVLL